MSITIIHFEDLREEEQERFREQYEEDYPDDELDRSQLIMVDLDEANKLVKPELIKQAQKTTNPKKDSGLNKC